jgi:hypothetical protein
VNFNLTAGVVLFILWSTFVGLGRMRAIIRAFVLHGGLQLYHKMQAVGRGEVAPLFKVKGLPTVRGYAKPATTAHKVGKQ